jgi:nitroimidazol reductase NimA-like FMN-containing flavoprotein (pyridoxamine 5'-phosphate oxidase superfamily)
MLTDPRTWMEILGTEDCWELLASRPVGRVAVATDNRPEIYPVNHVVDDRSIVFRTEAGTKLAALDGNPSVCFEVDDLDLGARTGWSVVVHGRARTLGTPAEIARVRALALEYWAVGDKPNFVQITATSVSGRRIHAGAPTS